MAFKIPNKSEYNGFMVFNIPNKISIQWVYGISDS